MRQLRRWILGTLTTVWTIVFVAIAQQNVQKMAAENHWDMLLSTHWQVTVRDLGWLFSANWFWFVFGALSGATTIAWLLEFIPKRQSLTSTATHIRLQFHGTNRDPSHLLGRNIWRWYVLRNVALTRQDNGQVLHQVIATTLFLVFSEQISAKEVRVISSGQNLPHYEVKDYGPRHALVVFGGDVVWQVVDVEVLT